MLRVTFGLTRRQQAVLAAISAPTLLIVSPVLFGLQEPDSRFGGTFVSWLQMQLNTAVCASTLALGCLALVFGRRRLARIAAFLVGTLAILTLLEAMAGLELGIDQLLRRAVSAMAGHPGRMAPNTAVSFLAASVALGLLSARELVARTLFHAGLLASLPIALGVATIASYLRNVSSTFGWGSDELMSLPTAGVCSLIGLAELLNAHFRLRTLPNRRSQIAPIGFTLMLFTVTVALWQLVLEQDAARLRGATALTARAAALKITQHLEENANALKRMATRLEYLGTRDKRYLTVDSRSYVTQLAGFQRVGIVGLDYNIRWSYPPELSAQVERFDQSSLPARKAAFDWARERHDTGLSGLIELRSGGRGFLLVQPLFSGQALQGYVYASIDADLFFSQAVNFPGYAVVIRENGSILHESASLDPALAAKWAATASAQWRGSAFEVALTPTPATISAAESPLPLAVLLAGLLISFVIGSLVRSFLFSRDELRSASDKLRALVDSSPVGILALDDRLKLTIWNPACERIFGYSAAESLGHFLPYVPQEHVHESLALIEQVHHSREAVHFQVDRRRKDGLPIKTDVSAVSLVDENGAVNGLMAIVSDITEKHQMQLRLETAVRDLGTTSAQLKHLIDSSPAGILVMDPQLNLTLWNPACERIFGWTAAEALGRYPPFVPQTSMTESLKIAERIRNAKGPMYLQLDRVKKNGEPIKIEIATTPLFDGDDSFTGMMSIVTDMTERFEMRRKLEEALATAVEASKVKSAFLANMSHEIRTPINGVIGMAEALLDTKLDRDQKDCSLMIKRSAEALLVVINDILDFSKVEAGKLELESIDFDLALVVNDAVLTVSNDAARKGLHIDIQGLRPWPNQFVGDPGRLRQILLNLLSNAIKFTPRGDIRLRVHELAATGPITRFRFEVEDHGIGISKEAQGRLFQAFAQADTTTARRFGGSGLGLSICRRLVELMGGQIGVISEEGRGSTFWFELELSTGASRELGPAAQAEEPPVQPSLDLQGKRVLVVEDNAINQKVILLKLRKLGLEVDLAPDGQAALAALEKRSYHLVLMDCQMPVLDGYETTRRIRAAGKAATRDVPVIAMTAIATSGESEKCKAAGMSDFLSKPVKLGTLIAVLEKWLLPTLERAVLDELRQLDPSPDGGVVRELVGMLLTNVPRRLADMRRMLEAGDADGVRREAHQLKSSAGNLGARRFHGYCQALEQLQTMSPPDRALELLKNLDADFALLREALNEYLSTVKQAA